MLRFVAIGERALGTQQRKRMAHDRCRRPKMMLSKKLEQIICSPSLCASLYVEYVLHYVLLFAEQMHCVCVCVWHARVAATGGSGTCLLHTHTPRCICTSPHYRKWMSREQLEITRGWLWRLHKMMLRHNERETRRWWGDSKLANR